jgi:hypothetical protein
MGWISVAASHQTFDVRKERELNVPDRRQPREYVMVGKPVAEVKHGQNDG